MSLRVIIPGVEPTVEDLAELVRIIAFMYDVTAEEALTWLEAIVDKMVEGKQFP